MQILKHFFVHNKLTPPVVVVPPPVPPVPVARVAPVASELVGQDGALDEAQLGRAGQQQRARRERHGGGRHEDGKDQGGGEDLWVHGWIRCLE